MDRTRRYYGLHSPFWGLSLVYLWIRSLRSL
jgi:hypothetical protein